MKQSAKMRRPKFFGPEPPGRTLARAMQGLVEVALGPGQGNHGKGP